MAGRTFYHHNPATLVLRTPVFDARPGRVLLAEESRPVRITKIDNKGRHNRRVRIALGER